MSIKRTATLALAVSTALLAATGVTLADSGAPRDVRAIRSVLPALVDQASIERIDAGNGAASAEVVAKDGQRVTVALRWLYDRWSLARDPIASLTAAAPHTMTARVPTEAESWHHSPGGNAYAYFTIAFRDDRPIDVPAGATVTIDLPYVPDRGYAYSVTLANTRVPVGPVDGTLHAHVLTFTLPAFTALPGATIMGEVDGDPPHG